MKDLDFNIEDRRIRTNFEILKDEVESGESNIISVVTDIRDNAGTIEKKTRSIDITDGRLTAVGDESDWTAI